MSNNYPLCFWKVRDRTPEAHILGSIHFLAADFYPLAPWIEAVIDRTEILLYEAGNSERSPSTYLRSMGFEPIEKRLAEHSQLLIDLRKAAEKHHVDLARMDDYALWLVGLSVHQANEPHWRLL